MLLVALGLTTSCSLWASHGCFAACCGRALNKPGVVRDRDGCPLHEVQAGAEGVTAFTIAGMCGTLKLLSVAFMYLMHVQVSGMCKTLCPSW